MSKPIVAVVGRPNVGKSTLFNKIVGRRLSIVEDTPGVTRDRIYGDGEWRSRQFMLIDTGGIEPASDDIILSQMRSQAQLAIDSADVIIMVTDLRSGVVATDMEVAAMLQKSGRPVVLCVNKCDSIGNLPPDFYEFYNLGLGEPYPVSAVHGHGTGDLLDAVFEYFPPESPEEQDEEYIKVAIIGKPNAGKSSLVNKVAGEERVIVSDIAGTTRDAIDTVIENAKGKFIFIDTAGIRKTHNVIEAIGVKKSLKAIDNADLILLMINNNEKITNDIQELVEKVKNKKYLILINKNDLETKLDRKKLKVEPERIVELSILEDKGIDTLKEKITELFKIHEIEKKDPTYLSNTRSISILKKCLQRIKDIEKSIKNNVPIDIIELDIKNIWEELGKINGTNYEEELLDEMFSRFCLGK